MHLDRRPSAASSGTSGIVGQGIPQATGAACAAQIRKQGQVVLCFFGDGASKQGAFHESLNIASLWKLPIVFVMENNGYNVAHAHRAGGRERAPTASRSSVKAKALLDARRDDRRRATRSRSTRRSAPRSRALAPATGRRSSSRRSTASRAHGNIIAPPGVPLHFPEHEAIEKFGAPEEYEAALRGDPVPALPRPARRRTATLTAERGRRDRRRRSRDEMQAAVDVRAREPLPRPERRPRLRLRVGATSAWQPRDCPTSPRSTRRSTSRWSATRASCTSARTWPRPRTTPFVDAFGKRPRARHADLRDGRDRHGDRRRARPASGPWSSSTWPSSCSSPWTRWSTRRRASAT